MKRTITVEVDESPVVQALTAAIRGLPDHEARVLLNRIDLTEKDHPGRLFKSMPADPGKDKPARVVPTVAMERLAR